MHMQNLVKIDQLVLKDTSRNQTSKIKQRPSLTYKFTKTDV